MSRHEKGLCPECGETIEIDVDIEVGDQLFCPGCDCELTVVKLHPPRFKALKEADLDELEDEEPGEERESDHDEDSDEDSDTEDNF